MAYALALKFSLLIICIPVTIKSRKKPRASASGRTHNLRCPWWRACQQVAAFSGGQTHSQSPESLFAHVAGLKTVIPSNPYDAKGMLLASIEDNDPVIFLEPKRLYNGPFDGHHDRPITPWSKSDLSETPEDYYTVPIGKASVKRAGEDVTVIAYGTMVHVCASAIEECGVDAELIDLRTILPLDFETVAASIRKTGRCVIVHEATKTCGFGAELMALIQEECFLSSRSADYSRNRV